MGEFLIDWLRALWMVLVESGPYLLVGFLIAGFLKVWVPANWIARRLGGDDVRSVASASLLGVPVPLCSCSVIPTATQLRRSGASRGATTSFLISTPETGVDSIGATWALMDPLMTVVRPVAAFGTAFIAGIGVNLFGRERGGTAPPPLDQPRDLTSPPEFGAHPESGAHSGPGDPGGCCHAEPEGSSAAPANEQNITEDAGQGAAHGHDHGDHSHPEDDARAPVHRRALRYAFGTLLDDLAPWFLIGFALSGLIVVALPDGFFEGTLFSGTMSMLVMLVAGVPLYVCATASTPIAAAMMAKGLEPGAALVFLLAGPATNVATMLVVRDLLGRRALAVYLSSIALMSLVLGSVTNRLYPAFGFDPTAMNVTPGAMDHGPIATAAGVVLAALLARSAWNQSLGRRFGAFLRRAFAPLGIDPTALPFKVLAGATVAWAWGSTAVTAVGPGETVFVERFGRVVASRTEPGRILHAPWPLAAARSVSTREVRSLEFGVDREVIADDVVDTAAMRAELDRRERLEDQAEMMTGGGVFVAIEYAVQFRVTDAWAWQYGHSDPEAFVRLLAQEALRRSTASRTVPELLVPADDAFLREAETRLSEGLARAGIGAELGSIEILSAHAPRAVHRAYREVASAMVEAETELTMAKWKATELLAEARIEAAETVSRATAIAQVDVAEAHGAVARLVALDRVWETFAGARTQPLVFGALRDALTLTRESGRRVYALLAPHVVVRRAPGAPGAQTIQPLSPR